MAKKNFIAVRVSEVREFAAQEIIVAFVTDGEILSKTLRTNARTVADDSERVFRIIFVAVLAETKMLVKAVFTDVNNVAVRIENVPSFRAVSLTLLAELAVAVIAVVAVKPVGNFIAARNAQAVGTNRESFEIESVIVANGNFGVEVPVSPVRITAETRAAPDMDVVFVIAVFFSFPEVGNTFKGRKFALNQIAIKLRLGLRTRSTTVGIVKATLDQKSVEGLIHEKLSRSLAIIESFGNIGVGGSENDESHIIASITRTAAIIIAISVVERVAGSEHRAAQVAFGIGHRKEMRRIDRHEKFEVDFLSGKLVGKLSKEALKFTASG